MDKIEKSRFEWVGPNAHDSETMARPSVTFWQDSMSRLLKNKVAVVCAIIIVLLVLVSVIAPFVSPFEGREQHLTHTNAPMFSACTDPNHEGAIHLFGTDNLGRDLFTRLWEGGRVSMFIAFAAVLCNLVIGVIYGGISGYFGGAADNVMMRIIEIINGIPYLIVVILLMMILPPGLMTIVVAYATTGWTGMARLVRGQVISLKEQEFVIAAKALGAGAPRLILRHLLPNSLSVVIVNLTLSIPNAIFTEAFLSYLGLGVPVPLSSWGMLAQAGSAVMRTQPAQLIIPALCISLTMFSFNLLGDGLRDAFDPKLRR
jgi:oligopeptide transport system permease protein